MRGDPRTNPLVVVAVGVAVHRQRLLAALVEGGVTALQFFVQTAVVQVRQQRMAGAMGAEAHQA
ncbi:hypothetical protein D3C76_1786270 [compost metagenome]